MSDAPADGEPTVGGPAETPPAYDPFQGEKWGVRSGTGRVRVRKKRRKKLTTRGRIIAWIVLGGSLLVLLGVAWVAVTGLLAKNEANSIKADFVTLRADIAAGDTAQATADAKTIADHASRMHFLTTGPAWALLAKLPSVGGPFDSSRRAAALVDSLGKTTLPKLVAVADATSPTKLAVKDHAVDISALIAVTPTLDSATAELDAKALAAVKIPRDTWLGPVNSGTLSLATSLVKLSVSLDNIDSAAKVAPTMLGYSTPQRYFVGFQNEAELRGTGGLPGAFGILTVDHGRLAFTHFGSDAELEGVDSGVTLSDEYNATWHDYDPTKQYLNSSVDPDFTYAGQIWSAMWQKKSGETVTGAIALDPTALSYLLAITGPTTAADGTEVNAKNIVALTQSTAYAKFDDQNARKAFLLEVARAAESKILTGVNGSKATLSALKHAVSERRILLWSKDKASEDVLSAATIGGAISTDDTPYSNPVIINYGANKLDYYLDEHVDYKARQCKGTGEVTVTLTLTNHAPASGLSTYVTQRTDNPAYPIKPGDQNVQLYYVATVGATLSKITIDGKESVAAPGTENSHPVFSTLVELPAGKTVTVVLTLSEPLTSVGEVTMPLQPHVRKATSSVAFSGCSS